MVEKRERGGGERQRAGRGKREEASRGKIQLRREKGGKGGELRQVGRDRLTQSREGQDGGGIEGKGTVEGEGVGGGDRERLGGGGGD